MNKHTQILKSLNNISSLINSLSNSVYDEEVKRNFRVLISKIEIADKKMSTRKSTELSQHQEWWNKVVAGTSKMAEGGTSKLAEMGNKPELAKDALAKIDQLIQAEQEKINAIKEREVKQQLFVD